MTMTVRRTRRPISLSVVIPVYNNLGELRRCLAALLPQAGPESEIIVVDDGSRPCLRAAELPARARLLSLPHNCGPAVARNRGVALARGRVVLFVDADVVVAADVLAKIRRLFTPGQRRAAVIGSYDAAPAAPGTVSRYRNLLHHYVHQQGPPQVSHFWTGLGAVRRQLYCALGGLDEGYRTAAIEDVEFGYRLRDRGFSVDLIKNLQGTHLKRWTLRSMIATDVRQRALPWLRLLARRRSLPADLSTGTGARLSILLSWLLPVTLLAAPLWPTAGVPMTIVTLAGFTAVNAGPLSFFPPPARQPLRVGLSGVTLAVPFLHRHGGTVRER